MLGAAIDWEALSAIAGGLVSWRPLPWPSRLGGWLTPPGIRPALPMTRPTRPGRRRLRRQSSRTSPDGSSRSAPVRSSAWRVSAASFDRRHAEDDYGAEPSWYAVLRNSGQASATIEAATLHLPSGLGSRGPGSIRDEVLRPDEARALSFAVEEEARHRAVEHGGEWTLTVPYREPGSAELRRFVATLKPKRDGPSWRWIVLSEETK
jgi:hypothetical protein